MKEFGNIESFIEHLALMAVEETHAAHHALQKCALVVEKHAKDKIGEYQQQTGPFVAWQELADSTKRDREKQGYPEDEPGLRSGEMRDSIGRATSVDGLEVQIGSNDDKMLYFEAGTSKQPPRSVLGGAVADKLSKIKEIMSTTLYGALTGNKVSAALLGDGIVAGGIEIEG